MTEQQGNQGGTSDQRSRRESFSEGLRQGLGVLSAFKEAIEETIRDARDRDDLNADRAKQVMRDALRKAQAAAGEAKERLDFAAQKDFDALLLRVQDLEARVQRLESEQAREKTAGTDA